MLKIGQNWGKIANYSPNAQQRSALLEAGNLLHFSLTAFGKKYQAVSLVIKVTIRCWTKT